jgi:hypothetical protein
MQFNELLDDAQAQPEPTFIESEVAGGMAARVELGEEGLEQVS